jgi:putative membrane protein
VIASRAESLHRAAPACSRAGDRTMRSSNCAAASTGLAALCRSTVFHPPIVETTRIPMRRVPFYPIALCCVALFASACGRGGDGSNASGGGSTGAAAGGAGGTAGASAGGAAGGSTSTAGAGAGASASSQADSASGAKLSDAQIVSTVAVINGGEMLAAQTAERKASSSAVKAFARQMITDHKAMQGSVDALAKSKKITPQTSPSADSLRNAMKASRDSLARLSGAAFDRAYITSQVAAHQQALDVLGRLANSAQDPDLKKALQDATPKVQAHLDRARTIEGQLPAAGAGAR